MFWVIKLKIRLSKFKKEMSIVSHLNKPRRTLKIYSLRSARFWRDGEVFSTLILYDYEYMICFWHFSDQKRKSDRANIK